MQIFFGNEKKKKKLIEFLFLFIFNYYRSKEIEQQKEEAVLKNQLARQSSKDPFSDPLIKDRFVGEVEKLSKYVESLTKPTCSGPSHLDLAWKVHWITVGWNDFKHFQIAMSWLFLYKLQVYQYMYKAVKILTSISKLL